MLRALPLVLIATAAFAGGSDGAFAPGQRWTCVTDMGAEAYMSIASVSGSSVTFSYGVRDTGSAAIERLCNVSDVLDYNETLEFCRLLLSDEFSDGHIQLNADCAAEAKP